MKKPLIAILFALLPAVALAAGGHDVELDKANIDPANKESLQRGAKVFVNYCMSCHAAKYQRYNRVARDLGIREDDVIEYLMFTGDKIGDHMDVAMTKADGKAYFGAAPPDLTLVARVRGVDWLYSYLRTFYLDDTRPFGVNNLVFPNVGMPHVLWELQGWQEAVITTVKDHDGRERKEISLELVEPGLLEPHEYDRAVRDLVNFLDYMGEPAKYERRELGVKVIMFLVFFLVVAYLMKRDYWKDVH